MTTGACCSSASGSSFARSIGVVRPHPDRAERLGELHEIGVMQIGPVRAAEHILQIAGDVAVGIVPEDDGRYVDAVLDRRGKLGGVEHEPAVSGHAQHGAVGNA